MPRGGKQPGAGRPKGTTGIKHKETISKELAREVVRNLVTASLGPMVAKQIAHAQGIDHFFLRHPKTKQFEQVTDPKIIEAALNSGDKDSYYWIFTKDPSVQAFSDLLNRALDKPAEQVKVTGDDGGPVEHVFRWAK
jgi:hypothetical protein